MRNDLVHKITLSGLILALVIIFTRFLSIQNIPFIPFVRISIGPALIIFSSIYLGPIFGAVIGGASDILGIVLVPNSLGYGINPFITIVYALLGVVPWVIYKLIKKVKKPQITKICLSSALILLWLFILFFLIFNNQITLFGKTYIFEVWHKILIIGLSFLFMAGSAVAVFFIDRHFKKKYDDPIVDPFQVAFASLGAEFLVLLILNSIVKMFFFEVDFLFIFFAQAIVFFIDIPLDTIVVTYLLVLMKKITHEKD